MTNETSTYLTYANLQMGAEAMLDESGGKLTIDGLKEGNHRSSKTPDVIAEQLTKEWRVVDHKANTSTGFSGTLFECLIDDPSRGLHKGDLVMSLRSTEYLDDAVRDNKATNDLEIKATAFALGQLTDLEDWYQNAVESLTEGRSITVTGYSLG